MDEIEQTEEVAAFVRTLLVVWRGESWDKVEPHAENAWNQIPRLRGHWPWSSVREIVRAAWRA